MAKIFQKELDMNHIEWWRSKIQNEKYNWIDREPNAVRLMMSIQRGSVLLGKDHVKILENYEQPNAYQNR